MEDERAKRAALKLRQEGLWNLVAKLLMKGNRT